MADSALMQMYKLLYERYGPQKWWPGEGRFEIIVGAILTQNTNWQNVEKAIANLKKQNLLDAQAIHDIKQDELAQIIRPAGYFNVKAKRLQSFVNWLMNEYDGNLEALENRPADLLRQELLRINGVGMETADSILLYGFEMPVFVIDAYTCRVFGRHGMIAPEDGYEQVQWLCSSQLPEDVRLYNEFHALLVRVGKLHCRPRAKCEGCPLEEMPHEIEEPI